MSNNQPKKTTIFKYRNREINLKEFVGEDFITLDDLRKSLIKRSRKSILSFCKSKNIPVLVVKDQNNILLELVSYSMFQAELFSESIELTERRVPQKKLPGMQKSLWFNQRRRALDFLKVESIETYYEKHLSNEQYNYRLLGLYIQTNKYYEFNVNRTLENMSYDLDGKSSKSKILGQIETRVEYLRDKIYGLTATETPTLDATIDFVFKSAKFDVNEQFYSTEELLNDEFLKGIFS